MIKKGATKMGVPDPYGTWSKSRAQEEQQVRTQQHTRQLTKALESPHASPSYHSVLSRRKHLVLVVNMPWETFIKKIM